MVWAFRYTCQRMTLHVSEDIVAHEKPCTYMRVT